MCFDYFQQLILSSTTQSGVQLVLGISESSVSRLADHSSRSQSGVKRYRKKPKSFSNEVSINNAKSPFPGHLAESFRLGNISIYLKPCSSTNLQNWIFFHDRRFLYRLYGCVYSLEAWKNGQWCFGTVGCCNHVYIGIFIQGKQIPIKFSEEFSNTVLCLWELHIALNYTCLWWVISVVFFMSVLGNISVYALVIFITLSVSIISSNLTFLDTKQLGVQLVLGIQRVLGVQTRRSFVTIREWSEKIP